MAWTRLSRTICFVIMSHFKFLIFLLVVTTTFAQRPSLLRPTRRERIDLVKTSRICVKELNFPREDASRLVRGYLDRDDEEAQCFVKCMYTKTQIMNEDGEIDEDRLQRALPKAIFPREKVPQWIETCRDVEAETVCERAYNTYACFLKLAFPEEEDTKKHQEIGVVGANKGEVINPMALINYGK